MASVAEDDTLSNLNWLTSSESVGLTNPPSPPTASAVRACVQGRWKGKRATKGEDYNSIDYRTTPVKPKMSYAMLISLAMEAYGGDKVLLTDIYDWLKENFAYFRTAECSWQNSIRHNLSLNKQFIKVARDSSDKGKGSYWMLDRSRKDPYCLRRRHFGTESRPPKPKLIVPSPCINPAVTRYLQQLTGNDSSNTLESNVRSDTQSVPLEDIGAQEFIFANGDQQLLDSKNSLLGLKHSDQFGGLSGTVRQDYFSPNPCMMSQSPQNGDDGERELVDPRWFEYDCHSICEQNIVDSGRMGTIPIVPMPLPPDPEHVQMTPYPPCGAHDYYRPSSGALNSTGTNSPSSSHESVQGPLELRIPTPEWWNSHFGNNGPDCGIPAHLLSPSIGMLNSPLGKPCDSLNSSGSTLTLGPMSVAGEHPWQDDVFMSIPQDTYGCQTDQFLLDFGI